MAPDEALHEAGPHRCAGRYFRAVSSAQPCCVSRRCFIPSFLLLSSLSLPLCCLSLSLAEFSKIAQATATGFAIMGFIGFFVKLIFIPINNIIGARSSSSKSYTATLSTNCVCSLSRCRALQSAWAEVVLLSRCMEERMDRMRGGGSLAAGFYEETREREALSCSCVSCVDELFYAKMAPTTR